jgi:RimJ/RimL family protein N-acetyltransferase
LAEPDVPVYNIVGERVALGPLVRDIVPLAHRWYNDFWIMRTYGGALAGKPIEAIERWYEREIENEDARWFVIHERATDRAIGLTDLFQIEQDHGLAWFGMMIGEADVRGKGYATETTRLMLDYAFTALNLRTVMLSVDEFNSAGRRAYARAGFREAGRVRGATLVAGKRYDRIIMDCVADEFDSPVLRAMLEPTTA